jgi:hypothetical protein
MGVGATITGSVAAADGDGGGIRVGVLCGDEEQATKKSKVSQMAAFVMTVQRIRMKAISAH